MEKLVLKRNYKRVSPELYGIFLEDINYACDGGLNANMVNNYSFDGVYLDKKKKGSTKDPLRYWQIYNGSLESGSREGLSEASRYAQLTVNSNTRLENLGYNGGGKNGHKCAMSITRGKQYRCCCQVRSDGFAGTLYAVVKDSGDVCLTEKMPICKLEKGVWEKAEASLKGIKTGYGKLVFMFDGIGSLAMDCVEFYDEDYWNKHDPKWRHGKLRKDLMETLCMLHPAFIRFPGGCIVEGRQQGNEYNWKDTVGELWERKAKYCLWAERVEDGGYCQSYQIGFYEYFCMCEDLGAKPLPTLFAGLNCQMRSISRVKTRNARFHDYVIQNYLDLIEFAIGDPDESKWARLRSDMGHPAPFYLDRIGIGNENMGRDYMKKYQIIRKAITERYPDMLCVMCAGVMPFKFALRPFWKFAKTVSYPFLIDEHSYHTPEWFFKASRKFDTYPRISAKVYFGEYAANGLMAGKMCDDAGANGFLSALSEAAFLTGVERNCDVVEMTSYAPLFNLAEAAQWPHNLIVFNPKTVMKTVNYYVQQMFAAHVGIRAMDVAGVLPKQVYASATEDEKAFYLKIVNGSDRTVALCFVLPAPVNSERVLSLTSDDVEAKNYLSYEGEPQYQIFPTETVRRIQKSEIEFQAEPMGVYVMILEKEQG